MLNPIITPPRVPLVDANTGLINRAWYLFFVSLNNIANDVVNDPVVGPSPESLIASYDALLQTLTQEIETQPSIGELVAQTAEVQKQIDALQSQIKCPCAELTAELQKQLDALQSAPASSGEGGSGTVTSVAATVPAFLSVAGSPITTSGTLAITLSGIALPIANGGTGETTRQAAIDALAGAVTSGQYLRGNGTDVVMSAIQAADVPTLNQNTTGTAANVTGIVAIANGGTGSTTLAGASIVTFTGAETLTNKRINPRVSTAASTATLAPDISAFDQYNLTAQAAALAVSAPIGTPQDGNKLIFRILDNGTARAITWNATYTAIGVTLPTTTTAGKMLYVGCIYNDANTRWDVIALTTQT